jgi:hypothetical protein
MSFSDSSYTGTCEACDAFNKPLDEWMVCQDCHKMQDGAMSPHKIHNRACVHTVIHRTGHRYSVTAGSFSIGPNRNVVFESSDTRKSSLVSLMIDDISVIMESSR